jgi:hypothetical protein
VAFQQTLTIVSAMAALAAAAVPVTRPWSAPEASSGVDRVVSACLATVAGALIAVGLVSSTVLRHVIQIAPIVIALGIQLRRFEWGASAAAPLFAFWFLLMGAIWLFLLGVARLVSGRFTAAEVILTVVIGAASLIGFAAVSRRGAAIGLKPRLAIVAFFAAMLFAAVWVSLQPFAARR